MKIKMNQEEVIKVVKDYLKKELNKDVKVKIINKRRGFEIECEVIENLQNKGE